MNTNTLESIVQNLQRGMLLGLSFVDDLLLLILSNLGIDIQWLQWLSPLLFIVSLAILMMKLRHWRCRT